MRRTQPERFTHGVVRKDSNHLHWLFNLTSLLTVKIVRSIGSEAVNYQELYIRNGCVFNLVSLRPIIILRELFINRLNAMTCP